jgi:hypothetical protein
MSLTVDLDEETEKALERKAARLGVSPSEYLARLAERSTKARSKKKVKTLADELTAILGPPDFSIEGTENWSQIEAPCDPH